MPIRFRCVYCNQLLGISRRKAGTIVRCTTCDGQLIVPDPNEGTTEPAAEAPMQPIEAKDDHTAGKADLFEHSDFDALLEPFPAGGKSAALASPPKSIPVRPRITTPPPALPAESSSLASNGLVVTRKQLTILSGLIVLGFGVAFTAGLLMGLSLKGG